MNLSDALDAMTAESGPKGPRCTVGTLLESLPDDEAQKLSDLLDKPLPSGRWVEATRIAAVLKDQGIDYVTASTLQRHRRRVKSVGDACQCPI